MTSTEIFLFKFFSWFTTEAVHKIFETGENKLSTLQHSVISFKSKTQNTGHKKKNHPTKKTAQIKKAHQSV